MCSSDLGKMERGKPILDSIRSEVAKVKKLTAKNKEDSVLILRLPPKYWLDLSSYNQVKTAQETKQPMLFLQGERDYQVPMADYHAWENALKARKDVQFRSYPKLNHFLVEGEGKSTSSEYMKKGNVAPYVIEDLSSWILNGNLK